MIQLEELQCQLIQVRKEKYLWKLQGGPRHFIFMLANCAELHNYTYLKSSTLKSRVGLDYTRMGYEVLIFGILNKIKSEVQILGTKSPPLYTV